MRYLVACLAAVTLLGARPASAADCHSNLMIVLDRSCSMNQPPRAGVMQTKWVIAVAAINKLTTKYAGKLDFGLIMFPDGDMGGMVSCTQAQPIYVNMGPNKESAINTVLMSTQPNGPCTTPIKPGIDQVSTDPVYANPHVPGSRRSFVLFISDGRETCGGNETEIEMSVKALYDKGYPTYVVGFGGGVDPAGLDKFALAGGVPRAAGDGGNSRYYQADDAAQLEAALDAIAGEVVGSGEFTGGCSGTPCPDGRCFTPGNMCIGGFCDDGTALDGGGGGSGEDMSAGGGGGGNGADGGCGCRVAGLRETAGALLLCAVVAVILLARRRRT
jgi:hypothetical protein